MSSEAGADTVSEAEEEKQIVAEQELKIERFQKSTGTTCSWSREKNVPPSNPSCCDDDLTQQTGHWDFVACCSCLFHLLLVRLLTVS